MCEMDFATIRSMSMVQNRFGIPFWLEGEFTPHVRTHFSGIESDVHWGLTNLDFEKPMTHLHGT